MDKAMARDTSIEIPEKLGSISVCDTGGSNAGSQIRTSARVHKKLRLDAALASERKDSESKEDDTLSDAKDGKLAKPLEAKSGTRSSDQGVSTTTSKLKRSSPLWSAEEKDTFFQALNEFGKDFETIQSVFVAKAHEKNIPENLVKSKEQIRLFYYRTWHKLSKYLKFSPDVKRGVQELYALINYGEFRKSVGLLTEKTCVKLNDLIHRGHAHFRIRGKYVKVKTPQCPTLQKLNRLDVPEWKEDLQLPSRVVVELRPRKMSDWCKVQSVAQNPRVRTSLPLDQRISSLLAFLQRRWRPPLLQHRDELLNSILVAKLQLEVRQDHAKEPAPILHVAPPPGVRISLPSFCLSEYLTSSSLSLSAYRERLTNRDSLPPLPRRMQVALSRSLSRARIDTVKPSLPAESTNHKKPCVLGKDVEALVAAAAAAAAAVEAKAKASGAVTAQIEGNVSCNEEASKIIVTTPASASSSPNSSATSPLGISPSGAKPAICIPAATDSNINISTKASKAGICSVVLGTKTGADTRSESSIKGKLQNTSLSLEVLNEKEVEADVPGEGELGLESEADVEVPVDTEILPPQEVPVQASGEAVPEIRVKTEVDAKADTKADMKIRAQIRKEKVAAKVEEIRQGWSTENAHAITAGELYLMFGHEGKIELEYWWEEQDPEDHNSVVEKEEKVTPIASALQKLVSISKLNFRKSKLICPCGHVCEESSSNKPTARVKTGAKNSKETLDKFSPASCTNQSEKPVPLPVIPPPAPVSIPIPMPVPMPTAAPPRTIPHHMLFPTVQDGVFRRPLLAPMYRTNPRTANVEAIKAQLEKFRPKYCNRRGRSVRQKGVVVQRMLPLLPKVPDGHAMLALKVIPQTPTKVAGEFVPIRPQPEGFSYSTQTATSALHIRPNDGCVIQTQQAFLKQNVLTSTPVTVAGTLDCQDNIQLQQIQQQDQIITVSIAPSNCERNLQTQLCSSLDAQSASNTALSTYKAEERVQPSSLSTISSPPPSISHLLDLDGGSTVGDDISLSGVSCGLLDAALAPSNAPSTSQSFSGLLSDDVSAACPGSPPLIKLNDQQWLNSEVGDFSLSSFLGHLESPSKGSLPGTSISGEESSDVEAQLQCLMSENSVDYSAKFAVLAAQIAASAENKK